MFKADCLPRQVKECFLLAETLKTGPFDAAGYQNCLTLEQKRIAGLSEEQVNQRITDSDRRSRYNNGTWLLTVVDLAACSVWPRMDGRLWATGPVNRVAERLKTQDDPTNKAWAILKFIQQSFSEVPLIVFRRNSNPCQFRIDDGCHRAVAYYLAGFRQAFAFVGVVDGKHNLNWRWEGDS